MDHQIILNAFLSVPEDRRWGIVIIFYPFVGGKIRYEYTGSFNEFENPWHISPHTFEELQEELEYLIQNQPNFYKNFNWAKSPEKIEIWAK